MEVVCRIYTGSNWTFYSLYTWLKTPPPLFLDTLYLPLCLKDTFDWEHFTCLQLCLYGTGELALPLVTTHHYVPPRWYFVSVRSWRWQLRLRLRPPGLCLPQLHGPPPQPGHLCQQQVHQARYIQASHWSTSTSYITALSLVESWINDEIFS